MVSIFAGPFIIAIQLLARMFVTRSAVVQCHLERRSIAGNFVASLSINQQVIERQPG
jgi:hypothetical protein